MTCIFVYKGTSNYLWHLTQNLSDFHCISFAGQDYDDPAQEWIDTARIWKEEGYTMPITSESENEVSENASDNEQEIASDKEQEESTVVPQLPPSIIRERHSDSSSDSSSGKSSNSKSKKKSKNDRNYDKISAKYEALRQQNKARFIKNEAAQQQNIAKITEVLENQLEINLYINLYKQT